MIAFFQKHLKYPICYLVFSFAFIAQTVALLVSCMTNLILPKILGASDFSYWQLFIFYATYIPCLAMGLNDGVYLRYGGKERNELDFDSVKSQYVFGILFQSAIAAVIGIATLFFMKDIYRKIVIIASLFYFCYIAVITIWDIFFRL